MPETSPMVSIIEYPAGKKINYGKSKQLSRLSEKSNLAFIRKLKLII